jgi:hypothetical protein
MITSWLCCCRRWWWWWRCFRCCWFTNDDNKNVNDDNFVVNDVVVFYKLSVIPVVFVDDNFKLIKWWINDDNYADDNDGHVEKLPGMFLEKI